ncbi:MAG: metal-dependent hydrolase [Candidatus Woesearchaeota archaeon]
MQARTHLMFAFLFSLLIIYLFPNLLIYVPLILLGSLLPDLDHPNSKLGRKFWPLSKIFNLIFGHRGFFHSLLFVIFIFISVSYFSIIFALAISIGILTHLLSDALTVSGVALFYPISNFKISGFIRTGSWLEYVVYLLLYIASTFVIYKLLEI